MANHWRVWNCLQCSLLVSLTVVNGIQTWSVNIFIERHLVLVVVAVVVSSSS